MMLNKENIENIYTLTPMQEGMFYHWLKDKSSAYLNQFSYRLKGTMNIEAVEKSIDALFERYQVLRTVFSKKSEDRILQIVLKERKSDFLYEDISNREDKDEYLIRFKEADRNNLFDLTRDVLMRLAVFRVSRDVYEFTWTFHHIIMDGWCLGILIKDFIEIYISFIEGRPFHLPAVKPFRDYIKWLENQDKDKAKNYWYNYLQSYEEACSIPGFKRSKTNGNKYVNENISYSLAVEKTSLLNRLAKKNQVTLSTIIKTIWGILVGKYNDKTDVVFGSVVSGRPPEIEDIEFMVGLFINTIPARITINNKTKFNRLLQRVQEESIESETYHYYPLVEIQSHSSLKQNLIDHIVVFENYPMEKQIDNVMEAIDTQLFEQTSYDFNLIIVPNQQLTFRFNYNAQVYENRFVEKMFSHLVHVLNQVIENEEKRIEEIILVTEEEKSQLLYDFNNTRAGYPEDKTLPELFEEQVKKTPGKTALIFKNRKMDYRQLNKKTNQLGRYLRRKGVKTGTVTGIMKERSFEMVVGIIGILKAGSAYLPLDIDYPGERIGCMLADSGAKLILTCNTCKQEYEDLIGKGRETREFIDLEDGDLYKGEDKNLEKNVVSHDPAYVIYTSGSTGKPKGVIIQHHSVTNRLYWMQRTYPLGEDDVILQKTPVVFDVSVWELFWWALAGAALTILGPGDEKKPGEIIKSIEENKVTTLHFVPSMLNSFLEYLQGWKGEYISGLKSLRQVFSSGEELQVSLAEKFKRLLTQSCGTRLVNLYGPTEAAVDVSYFNVQPNEYYWKIPIGRPIDNTRFYILTKNLQLQPVGIPGELAIAGVCLSPGYLNRVELTSKKFIKNPLVPYEIIYKTGDLARWTTDDHVNIEFLGRLDQQVKIRGFRIEPGEIENHLLKITSIKETVVIAREDERQQPYLCAYVVVNNHTLDVPVIKSQLSKNLPQYMIPSYFVQLDRIPLTANGKIDRRALPVPRVEAGKDHTAPQNAIEKKLVEIWSEILDIDKEAIGTQGNFFELGAHSLNIIALSTKIHKEFNVEISFDQIFKYPGIKALANYIKEANEKKYMPIEPVEKKEYYILSSEQKRMYILQQKNLNLTGYNIPLVISLEGEIDRMKLEDTFKKLINRHESLRTSIELIKHQSVQRIHNQVDFHVQYYEANVDDEVRRIIGQFIKPFDLNKAPFFRVASVNKGKNKNVLLLDMHHIISDAESGYLIVDDFMALYNGKELPPLRIQYKDYAEWQNSEARKELIKRQQEYWLKKFYGQLPVLHLPTDYARPPLQNFEGRRLTFKVEKETKNALQNLAVGEDTTLYMVLLAVYYVLLFKISKQEDIIIGTAAAGRKHPDLEPIVGMFVKTLAVRNYPSHQQTFKQVLGEVKKSILEGFANQDYPFEKLAEQVNIKRDISRNPLFDIMFEFRKTKTPSLDIAGLKANRFEFETRMTKFDMSLYVEENPGNLTIAVDYNIKLFKKETIEKMVEYFLNILTAVLEDPETHLSAMRIEPVSKSNERQEQFNVDLEIEMGNLG
ncbi:MAG: amino acid adenylation domain-containing protein [Candidatus Aminicenantes bacterium]|nr:MAG: amino acid adenylation domain-containing protein [Candidatus Aminicenantes bacterium]